jgi:hypothetical protein
MLARLRLPSLFMLLVCVMFLGAAVTAHAQTSQAAALTDPPATGFGAGAGLQLAATPPAAQYDEQLGTTFTQNFASLAYNVTAAAQADSNGYGPAYLLNGLSSKGYWYQVGVSYDWPLLGGGFSPGFNFNYEVFNANGVSVFPTDGSGGLTSFSGTVNAGDSIGLSLSFSGVNVLMFATDYNTGATASETYNAVAATVFDGSPLAPSNPEGFFTGLMTEWYHAAPYYVNEGQATYSNARVALSSAWMWIDEYQPTNETWTGSFSAITPSAASYTSAPNTLQPFNSHGATEAGDAFEFVTGSSATTTTTITLLSASLLTPLAASNSFAVYYTLDGLFSTASAQDGTLTLTTDIGSAVTISTVSTGSTTTERWVLDSQGGNISIASGSSATYYYYDLLVQSVGFATSDGSTSSHPMLQYYTAPPTASSQPSETSVTTFLLPSAQAVWAVRGSLVSVQSTIAGKSGEQWSLQTSEWTINSVNLVPSPVLYYHQYYVAPGYNVKGGGSGYGAPTITCLQYGVPVTIPLSSLSWVDAGPSCSYSPVLPGSTQDERWAIPSPTATVSQPGAVSVTYFPQYLLRITYSIIGGSPNPPTVTGVSFTTSSTVPLSSSPATEWFDSGSSYSISNPLSSSTASERWETAGTTKGAMQGQVNVTDAFYHQFLLTASYSVIGGASGTTSPALSYMSFGSPTSIQLNGNKQNFWSDVGTQYSVPQTLAGSSVSERWYTQTAQGTVQASSALSFSYNHQFFLSVTGGALSSQWYNSSSTAKISEPGVFARASGSGQRVTSYSIDGTLTAVKATAGTVSISILMDAAHQLVINSVQQYQVSLDVSSTAAISSITSPTVAGDSYWYDQGTSVSLVLNGIWGRSAGAGERLLSYSLNGASKAVSTTGLVDVLTAVTLTSPETITAAATAQYRLDAIGGSVATGTIASIPGDTGWYDSGTSVTVSFYYSWNSTSGTRQNAVGYSVTGSGNATQIARSSSGTFPVQLTMSRPETITIDSVTQYSLTLSPGQGVSLSLASPTLDSFYDSGTTLTATTPYTWDVVNNVVRQNLVSFTLDSLVTNVTRADSGSFTTPAIVFNGPQALKFNAATQALVALQFTNSAGTNTIVPTLVQIQYGDSPITSVPSSGVWLDYGTKFQLSDVQWEGADVKPASQTFYTVNAPANETVEARVYSGSIAVTDYLGLPISGARVSVTLVNGTIITTTTSNKGTVALPEIPIGNYTASISYLGTTTTIGGNAALAGTAHAKILASYPTFVLAVLAVAFVIIIAAVLISPGRRLRKEIPPGEPSQHLTQVCKNCNATIALGSLHCPECGAEQV